MNGILRLAFVCAAWVLSATRCPAEGTAARSDVNGRAGEVMTGLAARWEECRQEMMSLAIDIDALWLRIDLGEDRKILRAQIAAKERKIAGIREEAASLERRHSGILESARSDGWVNDGTCWWSADDVRRRVLSLTADVILPFRDRIASKEDELKEVSDAVDAVRRRHDQEMLNHCLIQPTGQGASGVTVPVRSDAASRELAARTRKLKEEVRVLKKACKEAVKRQAAFVDGTGSRKPLEEGGCYLLDGVWFDVDWPDGLPAR